MTTVVHSAANGIHPGAYHQSSDPGAVGMGVLWVDTSSGPPYQLKARNTANTAWEAVGIISGGGGGGNTLVAAVPATDGATAACSTSYVALSTPWITASITTTATQDIIIEAQISWTVSADLLSYWGIWRGSTQIFNTSALHLIPDASIYGQSATIRWVDRALAAGTYTYEIRPGTLGAGTVTLKNATAATPANASKGGSMLTVSSAANV